MSLTSSSHSLPQSGEGDAESGRKDRQDCSPGSSPLAVAVSPCLLWGVDENCSASTVLNAPNGASGIISFQINKTSSLYVLVLSHEFKT